MTWCACYSVPHGFKSWSLWLLSRCITTLYSPFEQAMRMWSFHDGCADLEFGVGVSTVRDLACCMITDFDGGLPSLA